MKSELQYFREKNMKTQEDLAKLLDVSIGSVRNWEQGRTDLINASFINVLKICYILNCKPSDLFKNYPDVALCCTRVEEE